MFLTKQTPPPSAAPEPEDVLEVRFKLSGSTLTKLISLVLSIALGSGIWGYLQAQPASPTGDTSNTTEIAP